MKSENFGLGDRMKEYEAQFTHDQFMRTLPVIVRLDGRAFHSWTKGLERPVDERFMRIMQTVTGRLVKETGAVIGYTQSDEITLILYQADFKSQIYFDGKVFKLISVCASLATAAFNDFARAEFPEKPSATFDCRAFQVPDKWEAVNCLIWREQDAVRNSILAQGQAKFSHRQLHGLSCAEIQEKLFSEHGVNWASLPDSVRKGTYVRVEEGVPQEVRLPPLQKIANGPDVIFDRINPEMKAPDER